MHISSRGFLCSSWYSGPAAKTQVSPSSLSAKIFPFAAHGERGVAPGADALLVVNRHAR